MYSQKIRLFSLNLVLVMLLTLIPVQAADIVIDNDGPLYTVVLNGNGGTYGDEKKETLSISYGNSPLYLEDYIFTKEGCTLLGWRESADENATTLDYTRFALIYGGGTGENTRTLYAVWGEGENCALYDQRQYVEGANQLGGYWVFNSTTLPEVTGGEGFIGWYDHLRSFYTSGEAKAGEVYFPLYSNDNPIVLDGNGGTSNFGGELFFGGSKWSGYFDEVPRSGARCFSNDGYILDGWTDESGAAYVIVTGGNLQQYSSNEVNGVNRLSARWSKAYQLTDGAKLIINDNEMNALLMSNSTSDGNGWRFYPDKRLHLYNPYSDASCYGIGGVAYDGNFDLSFDGNVATGQIEANGRLGIHSYGSDKAAISVVTTDTPAIHAESVELIGGNSRYQIGAENTVGIDASYVYLGSTNITIVGNPAVRPDAQIACYNSGIGYTISEDRTTLTTYAIEQSITLHGNGGKLNGEDSVTVPYSVNDPLDLSQYAFTRDGYVLVGWAADAEGTKLAADAIGHLKGSYSELYAVWLQLPENDDYVIFSYGAIKGAFSSAGHFSLFKLTDNFTMPKVPNSSSDNGLWIWRDSNDSNLFYYENEQAVPASKTTLAPEYYSSNVMGVHTLIFDGNGGTASYNYNGNVRQRNKASVNYYTSDTNMVPGNINFKRSGYILTGYNTQRDGTGTAYPINSIETSKIGSALILYAQWSPMQQLKDGERLVIDGSDMTGLLEKSGWSIGTGWRFSGRNDEYSGIFGQLELTSASGYNGGSIALDGELALSVADGITTGPIEAAGKLTISGLSNGARIAVHAENEAAIRAAIVSLNGSATSYHIEAENAVGIDAANIYLYSPNVTITGTPAVRDGAQISCGSGISYTITKAEDGSTTLTTSAIEQSITLHGNGGTFNGEKNVIVSYSTNMPNLSQYAFTREGHVLVGWAEDEAGKELATDATGHLKYSNVDTLYAVWLQVPESDYVILRGSYGNARYTKGGYSSFAMNADGTFTLPQPSAESKGLVVYWVNRETNEPYLVGETVKVPSGTRFNYTALSQSKLLIFDGNGATMDSTVNGKACQLSRMGRFAQTGNSVSIPQFLRPGYVLTGYNTAADGSGTAYPVSGGIAITDEMSDSLILYAQWKELAADAPYISIDGKKYSAEQSSRGDGWWYHAESDPKQLTLNGYQGGSIETNVDLWVTSHSTDSTVTGSISAPNLTIIVQEGSLRVISAEGSALRAAGELNISCNEKGNFEASGNPTALSYGELIKDGYQTYLICGGADKEHAEQITNDTFDNLPYISYERRDRVLTLHGSGGTTKTGEDIVTVSSKNASIDLTAYAETFTNGDKRLLGWSKQENASTIDYAAASGVSYDFNWYQFEADLYAVWESESQRGVVLNDYGYFTGQGAGYRYAQQYTLPVSGETFTLPESYRAGYHFTGWLGSDGKIYPAGHVIAIPTALSFTAQYTVGTITVGGATYSMDQVQGSPSLGWMFYPDGYYGSYLGYSRLNINEKYSGEPIRADGNLWIIFSTNNDLTAPDSQPMIEVTGDLWLQTGWYAQDGVSRPYSQKLVGGAGAPAVKAAGTLHVGSPVTLVGGGENTPAMEVKALDAGYAFLTGTSETTAERAGTYKNEHYFRMDLAAPATFQPGQLIPNALDTDTHRFVGWREFTSDGIEWYLPGDTFEGTEKTMSACYIAKDAGAFVLNGNGGTTIDGQKYFVRICSGSDLQLTEETAQSVFHRDGYELTGYNTDRDGEAGTSYTAQELAAQVNEAFTGVQTFYAQWQSVGEPTPGGEAFYTPQEDGVRIEAISRAKIKKEDSAEIDLSGLIGNVADVILPADVVKNILALDVQGLTIKTDSAAVTLPFETLCEAASKGEIKLHVSTAQPSQEQRELIGATAQCEVLDVSLTVNGEEVHDLQDNATVSIPFAWETVGALQAWYLAEDNRKEAVDVAYHDGNAVLTLSHFSTYAVTVTDAPNDTIVNIGKNSVTVNAPESNCDSCIAALFSADGRQLAVGQATVNQVGETTVTWGAVNSAEVLMLKLFWLDANGAPSGRTPPVLVKVSAR